MAAEYDLKDRSHVRGKYYKAYRAGHELRINELDGSFKNGGATGLAMQTYLHEGIYKAGSTAPDAEMETFNLERHAVCPNWNYTLRPRSGGQAPAQADPEKERF